MPLHLVRDLPPLDRLGLAIAPLKRLFLFFFLGVRMVVVMVMVMVVGVLFRLLCMRIWFTNFFLGIWHATVI